MNHTTVRSLAVAAAMALALYLGHEAEKLMVEPDEPCRGTLIAEGVCVKEVK